MENEDTDLLDPSVTKLVQGRSKKRWAGTAVLVVSLIVIVVVLLGAGFTGGLLVGKAVYSSSSSSSQQNSSCIENTTIPAYSIQTETNSSVDWGSTVSFNGTTEPVTKWLDSELEPKNIREYLKELTERPHIAGNDSDQKVAMLIYDHWKELGFDRLELFNYSVLLQYAGNDSNPNRLELRNSEGNVLYNASIQREKPLLPLENDPSVSPPFNAYSATGNASGGLVYVNYGRQEDFVYLNTTLNISLAGRVCIIRYSKIFRGDKVYLAQQSGCVAVIIYSDPEDYAPRGGPPTFPNGTSLPPSGVQRGSVFRGNGDPLTPGVPSIQGVHRINYEEVMEEGLVPSIPVQPISYGDAIHFMRQLTEYPAPANWTGQLDLSSYYILQSSNNTNETYLEVNNYLVTKNITNVIAAIYGSVEPDRYVLLGNHHDAWTFGAADPNSGTAVLMELARAFSVLLTKNWRPGRTIVLCSWDAEEYGLIGSHEWTEEYAKLMGANSVAYLNVDIAIGGTYHFSAAATPLLNQPIFTATKMTKSPKTGFDTVYDEWLHFEPNPTNATPKVYGLGSGSDFTPFLQGLGITCSNLYYAYTNNSGYPVYHSVHDNFFFEANLTDPTFTYHTAMGLVWGKVALLLATSPVLPFDPRDYSSALSTIFSDLEEEYGGVLSSQNISLNYLNTSIEEFTKSAETLWAELEKGSSDPSDLSQVRRLNYQLMQLERAFIVAQGLPGRPYYKHVVYAPSSVNAYGSTTFPGVSDAIYSAVNRGGSWDLVREQLDLVRIHILYASQIMEQSYMI